MSSWFENDPERFDMEIELMIERSRAELRMANDRYVWVEELVSKFGQPFVLAVDYPDAFPHEAPKAFIVSPSVEGAPHRLADGSLCLWPNPLAGDGVKTTAIAVRNRAVVWFLAYEVWLATGKWSAPQHGGAQEP